MRSLYSINGIATESGRDRSVFVRALRDTPPDSKARGQARFYLSTIITALLADAKAGASADGGPTLTDARTRKALADAESAEFENTKIKGGYCRIADVISHQTAEVLLIRENLLILPGKMADAVAGADRIDAYDLLKNEVYNSLNNLADNCGATQFVIDGILKSGGSIDNPEIKKMVEAMKEIFNWKVERRAARKNKPEGDDHDDD